jgi:hypothetical protein
MDKVTKNLLLKELENLTIPMNIPFHRRMDFHWLVRNAGINNPNHNNLQKIEKICRLLMKEETDV